MKKTKYSELLPFESALWGRKILVTGHTGFTVGWACLSLEAISAKVITLESWHIAQYAATN